MTMCHGTTPPPPPHTLSNITVSVFPPFYHVLLSSLLMLQELDNNAPYAADLVLLCQ